MCLSSGRSAANRFSRAFSSSGGRTRHKPLSPRCAHFSIPRVERNFADADLTTDTARGRASLDLAHGIPSLLFGASSDSSVPPSRFRDPDGATFLSFRPVVVGGGDATVAEVEALSVLNTRSGLQLARGHDRVKVLM